MAFIPDNDVNYQAFLKARALFGGPDALEFTKQFVQFMAHQCTLASTSNAALITSAITAAKTAVKTGVAVSNSDANFLTALAATNAQSGNDFNECLEHIVKGHCQLATAVPSLSGANQTSINTQAKTATKAAKHTY
jgi:hypothetical protein